MKPGHIQVFDGLRLTTQHMDHLQGAFYSAVEDIREILGLGKIQTGFEIEKSGEQAIIVQPGIAFDYQKNRIVSERPETVSVSFASGETHKYVCLQYKQVEDGLVEGLPTLIWDSCKIVLRADAPQEKDNLIPAAKLTRNNGSFVVQSLDDAPAPVDDTIDNEEAEAPEDPIPSAAPTETNAALAPESPLATPTPATVIAVIPWRLRAQQGVVRWDQTQQTVDLNQLLGAALLDKLGVNEAAEGEMLFTLSEETVALPFLPITLSLQTSVYVYLASSDPSAEVGSALRVVAQGEATQGDNGFSQFALSNTTAESGSVWSCDVNEGGVAFVPVNVLATNGDVIRSLTLIIALEKTDNPGFRLVCRLMFRGGITAERVQQFVSQQLQFGWQAAVGWQAQGEIQASDLT